MVISNQQLHDWAPLFLRGRLGGRIRLRIWSNKSTNQHTPILSPTYLVTHWLVGGPRSAACSLRLRTFCPSSLLVASTMLYNLFVRFYN